MFSKSFNTTVNFETYPQTFGVKVNEQKRTALIFAVGEIYPQSSEKEEEDKETDLCIVLELLSSTQQFLFNGNNSVPSNSSNFI